MMISKIFSFMHIIFGVLHFGVLHS